MYSDSDLEAAVAAGALSPDAASALRNYVASRSGGAAASARHVIAKPRGGVGAQRPRRDRRFQIAVAIHRFFLPGWAGL